MDKIHEQMLIRSVCELIMHNPVFFKNVNLGGNVVEIFHDFREVVEYLHSTDYIDVQTIKDIVSNISDISIKNIFESTIRQWSTESER